MGADQRRGGGGGLGETGLTFAFVAGVMGPDGWAGAVHLVVEGHHTGQGHCGEEGSEG